MKKLTVLVTVGFGFMFFGLGGCGDSPTEPTVESTPVPTPIPTPTPILTKTIAYKVTGTLPVAEKVTLSYYDKDGNHFSGVEVTLPWAMSWTITSGYSKILQISASWSDYENTNTYKITAQILKDEVVLNSDEATGINYIHACATEAVSF